MTTAHEFEPAHAPGVSRAAAESADTTININQPKREAPRTPHFTGDPHSTDRLTGIPKTSAQAQAQNQTQSQPRTTTARASAPAQAAPQVTTSQRINWGGVIGKVALITAAVVVGVVAFQMLAPAISGWAAGLGADSLLGTALNATVSGVNTALNALAYGASYAWVYVADLGASVWGALAGTSVAASGGASVAPVAASALGNAGGAIIVGGVAAAATPAIVKAVAATPVMETVHHVVDPTPTSGGHGHAGMDDGSMVAMAAKKTSVASQAAQAPGMDLPDMPDELLQQQKAASNGMKAASKMAHHADHESRGEHHESGHDERANTRPRTGRAQEALSRSASTNQAWLDRTGRSERSPAASNHVEAAGAKQRSGDYSAHVDADRVASGTAAAAV